MSDSSAASSAGILGELVALGADLVLEHLALRADRDVFAGRHRERARQQARHTRDEHGPPSRRRARHAQDEAHVRHQPVAGAEHGRAQVATAEAPAVAATNLLDRGGHRRVRPDGRAVDGHAAHLHGRQDHAQPRRPEAAHQSRDQPRARRRGELPMAACPAAFRTSSAQMPACAFGLVGQIGEQRTPLWRGLRFGHYAIEERGLHSCSQLSRADIGRRRLTHRVRAALAHRFVSKKCANVSKRPCRT